MTELLTIRQAAELAHVTRQTIYTWIQSGKIIPVKTAGGRLRLPKDQLIIPLAKTQEVQAAESYPVIDITGWMRDSIEQLGTKEKFWCWGNDSVKYLFKEGRRGSGENWAEKVASELCVLLGLPHATYDLAICSHKKGVITRIFLREEDRLVLGNELLAEVELGYEESRRYKQNKHTLGLVLQIMEEEIKNIPMNWQPYGCMNSAIDVFLGYLMLDAWIANQDRHHENWAMILTRDKTTCLAPSFDHASSLGRNESDANRERILRTRDPAQHIDRYVERARSAFYQSPNDRKPLSTLDAFVIAARKRPKAANSWLEQLKRVSTKDIQGILSKVPKEEISDVAIEFAATILDLNQRRLLSEGGN